MTDGVKNFDSASRQEGKWSLVGTGSGLRASQM